MLDIGAIDTVSVFGLFIFYIRGQETAKAYKKLEEAAQDADNKQEEAIKQGKCTPDLDRAYRDYKDSIAAEYFRAFWISPRTFPVSLTGSIISLILGWSSIPGLLLGFIASSPKVLGAFTLFFSEFSGNKSSSN